MYLMMTLSDSKQNSKGLGLDLEDVNGAAGGEVPKTGG
jgi:hypothetical protein